MKFICYFIVLTMFSITSLSNEKKMEYSVESVIDNVLLNYKKHFSLSFDMCSHNKHVGEKDTIVTTYNCMYYRLNDDNVSNCYIYIKDSNRKEKYYDYNNIYIINPKPVIIIHPKNRLQREFNLDIYFNLFKGEHSFDNYFLNFEDLEKIKTDSSKKVTLTHNENEIILKQEWTVEKKEDKYSYWNEFIIDKNSYNIIKKTLHLDFNGQIQHYIYDMKNIRYNDFDTLKISRRIDSLKSFYEVE